MEFTEGDAARVHPLTRLSATFSPAVEKETGCDRPWHGVVFSFIDRGFVDDSRPVLSMKIVLAYSGGLDTSVLLSWIREKYSADVIAFCADIGQEEETKGLRPKARKTGAAKVYIDDLREEFATDFIFPMMQAGAIYEGQYFLGTSIARPLIAKRMVEIARKHRAQAIAHGATGKGNDQVRFELAAAALAPDLEVIAPWRDEAFRTQFPGRKEMIDYCVAKNIPV